MRINLKATETKQRVVTLIASTDALDRDGERMDIESMTFEKDAPFLIGHNQGDIPVATANFRKQGNKIVAEVQFPNESEDLEADRAYNAYKSGRLKGASVGYIDATKEALNDGSVMIKNAHVVELSGAAVPSNDETEVLSIKAKQNKACCVMCKGAVQLPLCSEKCTNSLKEKIADEASKLAKSEVG